MGGLDHEDLLLQDMTGPRSKREQATPKPLEDHGEGVDSRTPNRTHCTPVASFFDGMVLGLTWGFFVVSPN
jgi:hypothetical protein